MGCVASTEATSVNAQGSASNTQNTGTIIEDTGTMTKQKSKMDAGIPDNQDLMEEFDKFYRTLDNPWLKLQEAN